MKTLTLILGLISCISYGQDIQIIATYPNDTIYMTPDEITIAIIAVYNDTPDSIELAMSMTDITPLVGVIDTALFYSVTTPTLWIESYDAMDIGYGIEANGQIGTHVVEICTWNNQTNSDTVCVTLTVIIDTDLSMGTSHSKKITIYPNPTVDMFAIENLPIATSVAIYSANGQLLRQIPNVNEGDKIDISDLEAGIYFVRVFDKSYRIIKQ